MPLQADTDTLWAVVIGALLATAGGFGAGQLEGHIRRRERERSAALLFGELLSTMKLIMRLADEARGRGDPYGPVTMRFLRAARRETEIYDRNRETVFDLRDASLRARIHTLVVRLTFSLDGVDDATTEIAAVNTSLVNTADPAARSEAETRLATLKRDRQLAFDFAVETAKQTDSLLPALAPLAKHGFDVQESAARAQ